MKDVAIIILNFNSAAYTLDCVKSIYEKTTPTLSVELVVVDNASAKADLQHLQQGLVNFLDIKLLKNSSNEGFGGGNMVGFKVTDAKYTLFLNNDTLLENDCIQILVDFMEKNENAGVATAQNYNENGNLVPSFDHFKGLRKMLLGRRFLEEVNSSKYPKRKESYQQPLAVNWVNGALLFFRTADFLDIGGFDSRIFLYFEESDLCYRLLKHGKKSYLVPEAKLLHYQGKSSPSQDVSNQEALISYLHITAKNHGSVKNFCTKMYLALRFSLQPKNWGYYKILCSTDPSKHSLRHLQRDKKEQL